MVPFSEAELKIYILKITQKLTALKLSSNYLSTTNMMNGRNGEGLLVKTYYKTAAVIFLSTCVRLEQTVNS